MRNMEIIDLPTEVKLVCLNCCNQEYSKYHYNLMNFSLHTKKNPLIGKSENEQKLVLLKICNNKKCTCTETQMLNKVLLKAI